MQDGKKKGVAVSFVNTRTVTSKQWLLLLPVGLSVDCCSAHCQQSAVTASAVNSRLFQHALYYVLNQSLLEKSL
jgi:hypothetical protein